MSLIKRQSRIMTPYFWLIKQMNITDLADDILEQISIAVLYNDTYCKRKRDIPHRVNMLLIQRQLWKPKIDRAQEVIWYYNSHLTICHDGGMHRSACDRHHIYEDDIAKWNIDTTDQIEYEQHPELFEITDDDDDDE